MTEEEREELAHAATIEDDLKSAKENQALSEPVILDLQTLLNLAVQVVFSSVYDDSLSEAKARLEEYLR